MTKILVTMKVTKFMGTIVIFTRMIPKTLRSCPRTNERTLIIKEQRVQVTTEETGSQRVQVRNGFQEEFVPGLNPESGRISSGVFLEWKLTFYGTGPEDSVSGYGDDDDDATSDVDLDL